jgi:dolichol-phosphate mannosyltransferase
VLGDGTPDTGCGLKLFSREAFLALPYFDHMHRFLPALMRRNGGEVVSVPVRHRERRHGRSHYGVHNRLWTGMVDMLGVLWLRRRGKLPVLASAPPVTGGERGETAPFEE